MRQFLKNGVMNRSDLVFAVNYLKAKRNWAFTSVTPGTADGSQHFEGLDFLLQRVGRTWKVTVVMGLNGEEDWMKYDKAGSVRKYWTSTFPEAPPEIFPAK